MTEIVNKCLVTKLGNSVSGNNFSKLGELIIDLSTEDIAEPNEKFYASKGHIVLLDDAENNMVFADGTTRELEDAKSSNSQFFMGGRKGKMLIKNKYVLESFSVGTTSRCVKVTTPIPLEELSYATGLVSIGGNTNGTFVGSIDLFANHAISYLRIENNRGITGNVASLAKFYHLRNAANLALQNVNISNTGVTGTIEGLIRAIRDMGSTSSVAVHKIGINGSEITFNGNTFTGAAGLFYEFEWTATTMTFNGVTINA